jgi:predicted nucleic acid-binding protein
VIEPPGLLDTNVFIHAYANDVASEECRQFLTAVESGTRQVQLDPLVLHELSYALPRYVKQLTRSGIAQYLLMVLGWDGVKGETQIMSDAVERWRDTPGLAFVDAYLAALAASQGCAVYSKNVRELEGQGVRVPNPLLVG